MQANDGHYYPVDRIQRIKLVDKQNGLGPCVSICVDGWIGTSMSEKDLLLLTAHIVVPTERYQLARYDGVLGDDPEADCVSLEPILAFAIQDTINAPVPLTTEGCVPPPFGAEWWRYAIVRPDGKFQSLDGCEAFDTPSGFLKYARRWMQREQDEQDKKAAAE